MFSWGRKRDEREERRQRRRELREKPAEHKLSQEPPHALTGTESHGRQNQARSEEPHASAEVRPHRQAEIVIPSPAGAVEFLKAEEQKQKKLIMPNEPVAQETLKHAPEALAKHAPPAVPAERALPRTGRFNPLQRILDETHVGSLLSGLGTLSAQIGQLHGTLNELADELTKSTSGVAQLNEPLSDVTSPAEEIGKAIPEVQGKLSQLTPPMRELPKTLSTTADSLDQLQEDLKDLRTVIERIEAQLGEVSQPLATTGEQLPGLASTLSAMQQPLTDTASAVPAIGGQLAGMRDQLAQMQHALADMHSAISGMKEPLTGVQKPLGELKGLSQSLLTLDSHLNRLQVSLSGTTSGVDTLSKSLPGLLRNLYVMLAIVAGSIIIAGLSIAAALLRFH